MAGPVAMTSRPADRGANRPAVEEIITIITTTTTITTTNLILLLLLVVRVIIYLMDDIFVRNIFLFAIKA